MKKSIFLLLSVCFVLASCLTEDPVTAALMLGGKSQAPVFLNCRTVSENEIEFEFSHAVNITSLILDPDIKILSIEDGNTVKVQIEETAEPGRLIYADLLAEDEKKNTVNVLARFRSRNNRMPELVINEICTEYSRSNTAIRTEFIEFKTLSAGNLGAMRVFILGNTNAARLTVYEFSPVEVGKGEYITLHLRTLEAGCKDEYGSNLAESGGTNSSPTGRDFWFPGNAKLLHKTGIVYVLDQDDNVLASIMMSEKPDSWWAKDYMADAAEFLFKQGAWVSLEGKICSPADAVITTGTTATRTICRDETLENTNTATDWYITATSSLTPGKPNNPKRYVN